MKRILLFLVLTTFICAKLPAADLQVEMEAPSIILARIPVSLSFRLTDSGGQIVPLDTVTGISGLHIFEDENIAPLDSLRFTKGQTRVIKCFFDSSGGYTIQMTINPEPFHLRVITGWLSLLPPLLAIMLALLLRQVLVALFVGIWTGAFVIYDFNIIKGFFYSFTDYIARAPADPDKMAILVFSLTLGGMVGVISRMGGTQGIVNRLTHFASNARRGQVATWLMGILIFFDDYANTLIVGSTMRPLTDKLRISREKLSYLVDSTAAPVANIAIISTWIGFELGLISAAFTTLGIEANAYITFFKTIPFNFYPLFALYLGLLIAVSGRDFGPMLKAERRTRLTGALLEQGATPLSSLDAKEITASEDTPKRWFNGLIPIAVVILTTLIGLWLTGVHSIAAAGSHDVSKDFVQYISSVIGASDSYAVLMWASFLGSISAIILALSQRILKLEEAISAWVGGVKAMILAALILTMAWAIGNICGDLRTADFVVHMTKEIISANFVPLLSFLTAAVISFATGTSWGVMAILMPIVIPIAHLLPQADPTISITQQHTILLSTIASVLAGATFGDHCSPISDTTIMSSMASGADHVDHVRTQLPYALLAGLFSIFFGYIPVAYGVSVWLLLPMGFLLILVFIRFGAKKSED